MIGLYGGKAGDDWLMVGVRVIVVHGLILALPDDRLYWLAVEQASIRTRGKSLDGCSWIGYGSWSRAALRLSKDFC